MALATRVSERPDGHIPAPSAYLLALSRIVQLVQAAVKLAGVQRIGLAGDEDRVDVWVILGDEALDDEERVYELAHECFASTGRPEIDVHVTALTRVAERHLPPMAIVYER